MTLPFWHWSLLFSHSIDQLIVFMLWSSWNKIFSYCFTVLPSFEVNSFLFFNFSVPCLSLLLLFLFCFFNELGSQILKFALLSSAKLFHLVQSLYSLLFDWIQLLHSYFFINFCMLFQFMVKDSTFTFFLFTFFFLNILLLQLKISFFLDIKWLLPQDFF